MLASGLILPNSASFAEVAFPGAKDTALAKNEVPFKIAPTASPVETTNSAVSNPIDL